MVVQTGETMNVLKLNTIKNHSLQHFRQTNNSEALGLYLNKKKHFRYVCKIKKVNLQSHKRQKLITSRKSPKEFWSNDPEICLINL